MHELFASDLENYQIKEDLNEAILIDLESTYYELNKGNVEREKELKDRLAELKRNIEKLEEKHFIKEEMPKETYDRFLAKYMADYANLQKEINGCGIYISNLKEMINEAVILCRNLRQMWQDGSIGLKEKLQNLIFPSGLVYQEKWGISNLRNQLYNCTNRPTHGRFGYNKKGT